MIYKVAWRDTTTGGFDHFHTVDNYDDAYAIYWGMVMAGCFLLPRLIGPVSANGASAVLLP